MHKTLSREAASVGEQVRAVTEADVIAGVSRALECKKLDERALALERLR